MSSREEWVDAQADELSRGSDIIQEANRVALDAVQQLVENFGNVGYQQIIIERSALAIGIGSALAEGLIPEVYDDMQRTLHKTIKGMGKQKAKTFAEMLRHIYIGKVIEHIHKELSKED